MFFTRVRILTAEPRLEAWALFPPQARPPQVGDTVRVLVPMHHRGRALIADTPSGGPVLILGRWRIAFARHHWYLGRPIWQDSSAEELLDLISEIISDLVLGWHRTRCEKLAVPLGSTPEFLGLAAAFDVSWGTVVSRGLRDQAALFDATERSRDAARVRLAWLPLLAVAAAPVLIFAVPRLVQVFWSGLLSLYEGSPAPLRETVHWSAAVRASGLPRFDLIVSLVCLGIVAVAAVAGAIRAVAAGIGAYHAWRADLTGAIRWRLLDEYRRVANAQNPPALQIRTAPGLAGLTAEQVITRAEEGRLSALAFDLGAGAIAISGSQGVGKTTLLTSLTGPENETTLGLLVAAPVRYEAKDFLLHLYAELCTAVLGRLGAREQPSRLRRLLVRSRRITAVLLRVAAALLLLVALVFRGTRELFSPPVELITTWLLVAAALLIVAGWVQGPRPSREVALAAEAARRLRQTRYLQTVSTERSAGLARSAMQLGWRRGRQWAEQPHTLPEVVQAYRQFAAEVAAWWRGETGGRGKLLIAVDEADRIADPAAAELFVNEIKAVFGVPHCVYLVSVSEEALANFERRVVRMRTVFDSAFDHVIRLRPLTLRESVDLLRHRIAGVPDQVWVLCHCLAGGMPRDVLRTARNMIDVHRSSPGPSPVGHLALRLVGVEVQAVKRGFQQQSVPGLAELLADPDWPGATGADLRAAAGEQLTGEWPATAIGAALLYYATVLDLFTERTGLLDGWDGDREPELVTDLARVHSLLAFDPPVAVRQLQRIQAYLAEEERRTGVLS
ncbi:hypothetical protein ACTI_13590 [Actinoplanes sp. OR16]|nr:hypothetical protein ACTI_13590 [Actinoplanes sp. OR16]